MPEEIPLTHRIGNPVLYSLHESMSQEINEIKLIVYPLACFFDQIFVSFTETAANGVTHTAELSALAIVEAFLRHCLVDIVGLDCLFVDCLKQVAYEVL